jgi:hypothetical protein
MAELSVEEARSFVQAIVEVTHMASRVLPSGDSGVGAKVRSHLALPDDTVPNTSASVPPHDRANLQLALNAMEADASRWDVIGLPADIGNYHGFSLTGLIGGTNFGTPPMSRQYVTVDIGVDETLACLRAGVVLTEHEGVPVAVLVFLREHNMPELVIEVAAPVQQIAEDVLARIRRLMDEHNVFRGKVLTFAYGRHGDFGIRFTAVPDVSREQVILPSDLLDAIEEHALGISDHRDALIAAHQHVKRGLLLYGPPGTGKTHTISYLLNRSPGRTTMILSGAAVGAVGQAGSIARGLQPATIVIEDVDLIGMDRSLPGGQHNSLLFQLLNEMDGLSGDADVLFVLTTNRVDLLEPALSARPGRVDQAIEIGMPDASARRELAALYIGTEIDAAVLDDVVARTEGFAAAFIKELARRATLASLRSGESVSDSLLPALDALLHQSAPVLRRTLAGDAPAASVPAGGWAPAPTHQ